MLVSWIGVILGTCLASVALFINNIIVGKITFEIHNSIIFVCFLHFRNAFPLFVSLFQSSFLVCLIFCSRSIFNIGSMSVMDVQWTFERSPRELYSVTCPNTCLLSQHFNDPFTRFASFPSCLIFFLGDAVSPTIVGAVSDAIGLEIAIIILPVSIGLGGLVYGIGWYL